MNIDKHIAEIKAKNKRIDNNKSFLWKTVVCNNRFDYYKLYIMLALKQGYNVVSFEQYFDQKDNLSDKFLILRHDVDHVDKNINIMYDIEKKLNVKSSYYFRFSTFNKALADDMLSNGFEVGFHYETIANYAKKEKITNPDDINLKKAADLFKLELEQFNKMLGKNCRSAASHGEPINVCLGIPNNAIFEDINSKQLGVDFEVYSKDLYDNYITDHIMDCDILYNYGFKYASNPIESLLKKQRVIVFLAHPNHWRLSLKQRLARVARIITKRYNLNASNVFKRI